MRGRGRACIELDEYEGGAKGVLEDVGSRKVGL
jgi:hypothetical protein